MNLQEAVVYDVETLPNVFTLNAQKLYSDVSSTWEISEYRNDVDKLLVWFNWLNKTQTGMIGFNSEWFDYRIIHEIMINPSVTAYDLFLLKENMFASQNRFENMIWQNQRFAPQIDLFKIHHFDNKAKTTSLKALEINMKSTNVVDPLGTLIPYDKPITEQQKNEILIPYNIHDVKETKKFAHFSLPAIEFRISQLGKIEGDVLNFNDTKIGAKILEQRLGEDVCYYHDNNNRKRPRQSPRTNIKLNEIIFPYVFFNNPEFKRVLDWMRTQELNSDDCDFSNSNEVATIKTKGVFKDVKATVGGMEFHFGTGGIHGSIPATKVLSDENYIIQDIDVASLYPSIAIANKLAPEHLGEAFSHEYASLITERKTHKKGTVENASLKLAANGTYGNSNNKFSVFYDPKFTMTITINGQLLLCMLAEWLENVPTLQFIQINTDGITYKVHKNYLEQVKEICKTWENYTCLVLEDVNYTRMWIRDVNNYVAEGYDKDGNIYYKQKGAYWHPDPDNYAESISKAGPPAWHKDFNPVVVTKAAVAAMTKDIDPADYIRLQFDPYDFMLRVKVQKNTKLMLGQNQIQGTSRYYIAKNGFEMRKIAPPANNAIIGEFRRANKLTDEYFNTVMNEIGMGVWDERIHTKNKSRYEMRETSVNAGWKICECNNVNSFDFSNLNYDWYIAEANKLIIS